MDNDAVFAMTSWALKASRSRVACWESWSWVTAQSACVAESRAGGKHVRSPNRAVAALSPVVPLYFTPPPSSLQPLSPPP